MGTKKVAGRKDRKKTITRLAVKVCRLVLQAAELRAQTDYQNPIEDTEAGELLTEAGQLAKQVEGMLPKVRNNQGASEMSAEDYFPDDPIFMMDQEWEEGEEDLEDEDEEEEDDFDDEEEEEECAECGGEGDVPCDSCGGSGTISCEDCDGDGRMECPTCNCSTVDCKTCEGEGEWDCEDCGGKGSVECEECGGAGTL